MKLRSETSTFLLMLSGASQHWSRTSYKLSVVSSLLVMSLCWLCHCNHVFVVSGLCLDDQKSLLLQLKNNFTFSESGIKLNSWNASDLQHQLCHSIWIQQVEGFSIPEFVWSWLCGADSNRDFSYDKVG